MAYKLISTEEMNRLVDEAVSYLMDELKNEQAAIHLTEAIESIYDNLSLNPYIYRTCVDPFLAHLKYREALLEGMNYMIVYRIDDDVIYLLGLYHTLENYADKIEKI